MGRKLDKGVDVQNIMWHFCGFYNIMWVLIPLTVPLDSYFEFLSFAMYALHLQQVEPFLCDCISVSKRLARAIEPFTEDSVPHTIEEAKESIKKNRFVRRKTLEALHIDELATEGSRINEHMKATKKLSDNPEFSNTLNTITKLMEQIDTVKGRLETLWGTRQEKLETNLKQQVFEKNAEQVRKR